MFRLLKRCAETAIKLPFAAAWDVISLGNMGEGSSIGKVVAEHKAKKQVDDFAEFIAEIKRIQK